MSPILSPTRLYSASPVPQTSAPITKNSLWLAPRLQVASHFWDFASTGSPPTMFLSSLTHPSSLEEAVAPSSIKLTPPFFSFWPSLVTAFIHKQEFRVHLQEQGLGREKHRLFAETASLSPPLPSWGSLGKRFPLCESVSLSIKWDNVSTQKGVHECS